MSVVNWSNWYRFDSQPMEVPNSPGIYEIQTDFEFGRLRGKSSIVYIGKTTSLKRRLLVQRGGDSESQMSPAEKRLQKAGHLLKFRYRALQSAAMAEQLEAEELWKYEQEHWELPPGNNRMPKKGIAQESLREAKPLFHNQFPFPLIRGRG